jgi:chromosomal replication initiation ATPase DnaA
MGKAEERLSRREWRQGGAKRCLERLRRADPEALAVISLVADRRRVDVMDLLRTSRSQAHIAAARQLAMYLVNVKLGRTMTDIGTLFGRDRTTVSHACRVVEDRREGAFEREVDRLEMAIDALAELRDSSLEPGHAVAC